MEEVIWKKIKGMEWYEVSNSGLVRCCGVIGDNHKMKPLLLKYRVSNNGYYQVYLHKTATKGRSYFVHRLIAEMFIPKTNENLVVNHKNGIKTDNRVENLEWCTQSENVKHSYRMGLQDKSFLQKRVRQIDLKTGKVIKEYDSIKSAGFAVTGHHQGFSSIGKVCNKREHYNQAFGYKWEWA